MPTSITIAGGTIYTDPPFNTNSVPLTCATVISKANSSTSVNDFLNTYHIDSSQPGQINSIKTNLTTFNASLARLDQGLSFAGTDINALPRVQEFLTSLKTTYMPIVGLVDNCLRESLQIDTSALKAAQNRLSESESRLAAVTRPEENVSYYEGWFPIIRPMTEIGLFGLFTSAIFMLLLSILVFLRLSGVQIDIQIPEIMIPYFTLPPNSSYYMYGGLATGIIGSLLYVYFKK